MKNAWYNETVVTGSKLGEYVISPSFPDLNEVSIRGYEITFNKNDPDKCGLFFTKRYFIFKIDKINKKLVLDSYGKLSQTGNSGYSFIFNKNITSQADTFEELIIFLKLEQL